MHSKINRLICTTITWIQLTESIHKMETEMSSLRQLM